MNSARVFRLAPTTWATALLLLVAACGEEAGDGNAVSETEDGATGGGDLTNGALDQVGQPADGAEQDGATGKDSAATPDAAAVADAAIGDVVADSAAADSSATDGAGAPDDGSEDGQGDSAVVDVVMADGTDGGGSPQDGGVSDVQSDAGGKDGGVQDSAASDAGSKPDTGAADAGQADTGKPGEKCLQFDHWQCTPGSYTAPCKSTCVTDAGVQWELTCTLSPLEIACLCKKGDKQQWCTMVPTVHSGCKTCGYALAENCCSF